MIVHLEPGAQLAQALRATDLSASAVEAVLLARLPKVRLTNVNVRRLARYGLLSGELSVGSVDELKALPDVKWVQADGEQRAI